MTGPVKNFREYEQAGLQPYKNLLDMCGKCGIIMTSSGWGLIPQPVVKAYEPFMNEGQIRWNSGADRIVGMGEDKNKIVLFNTPKRFGVF